MDHRQGDYKIAYTSWCLGFPPDDPEYLKPLLDDYEVRYFSVNWGQSNTWYANGYNTVSRRLLMERFGRDIFQECRQRLETKKRHDPEWIRLKKRIDGNGGAEVSRVTPDR